MSSALEFVHLPILYPVHIDVLNVPLLRQRPRVALTHEELHRRGVHVQAALLGAVTKLLGVLKKRGFSLSFASVAYHIIILCVKKVMVFMLTTGKKLIFISNILGRTR